MTISTSDSADYAASSPPPKNVIQPVVTTARSSRILTSSTKLRSTHTDRVSIGAPSRNSTPIRKRRVVAPVLAEHGDSQTDQTLQMRSRFTACHRTHDQPVRAICTVIMAHPANSKRWSGLHPRTAVAPVQGRRRSLGYGCPHRHSKHQALVAVVTVWE